MCKDCVKELFIDRGTVASGSSCFYANFKGCSKCGKFGRLKRGEAEVETESDKKSFESLEDLQFEHICPHCDHVVAVHMYTHSVDELANRGVESVHNMQCGLCGKGEEVQRMDYLLEEGHKNSTDDDAKTTGGSAEGNVESSTTIKTTSTSTTSETGTAPSESKADSAPPADDDDLMGIPQSVLTDVMADIRASLPDLKKRAARAAESKGTEEWSESEDGRDPRKPSEQSFKEVMAQTPADEQQGIPNNVLSSVMSEIRIDRKMLACYQQNGYTGAFSGRSFWSPGDPQVERRPVRVTTRSQPDTDQQDATKPLSKTSGTTDRSCRGEGKQESTAPTDPDSKPGQPGRKPGQPGRKPAESQTVSAILQRMTGCSQTTLPSGVLRQVMSGVSVQLNSSQQPGTQSSSTVLESLAAHRQSLLRRFNKEKMRVKPDATQMMAWQTEMDGIDAEMKRLQQDTSSQK